MLGTDPCGHYSRVRLGTHLLRPFALTRYNSIIKWDLKRRMNRIPVRASEKESEKDRIDWDSSWSNFKESGMKGLPETEARAERAPKFRSSSSSDLSTRRDNIRKQESILLDAYSSETFFKVAGGLVVLVLVVFVFVIGPP